MAPAPEPDVDQRRYAREITSLLALPAFWSGREPLFVVRTLFEALETIWPLAAAYANIPLPVVELLRVGSLDLDPHDQRWTPLRDVAAGASGRELVATVAVAGAGPLTAIRLPLGYVGDGGCLVLATHDPAFPNPTDRALLHAAVALSASALENARLLQQRDEAQRAKDEFLAMLGHELRNPLAPIVTALELMTRRSSGQKSREQEIIERQVSHLRTLVDDLLDVSRITRGRIELQRAPVELADIVARAVEAASPLVTAHGHALTVDVPGGLVVDGDATRLTQVVLNLLTNAAKYTPAGGRIEVRAERDEDRITLRVADNGIGIAPELMPAIFDLFVQGRRSAARSEGGLGLGLTIVKRLAELHGGTVSVRSGDAGSEFSLALPAAANREPAAEPDAGPAPLALVPRPLRILVVDDNRDAVELLHAVLEGHGHEVVSAHTATEALALARRVAPEVVLLDIGLPDIDGHALAAALRALHPGGPHLIAVTGYGQPHDYERSRRAGIQAHLVKPIEPRELLQAIHRVVEQPGLRN